MHGGILRERKQEPEMEERRQEERSEMGRDGGCGKEREGEQVHRPDQLSIACSIPFSPLAMNPLGSSHPPSLCDYNIAM